MNTPDETSGDWLRPIPRNAEGPLFSEPWEAQAFAIAISLVEKGLVTRKEWAEALGDAIKAAQVEGDPDEGDTYYHHVLAAVETLINAKGMAGSDELETRKQEWKEAYLATPHGQPVELSR